MGPTSAFCVASTDCWGSLWSTFRPASASPIVVAAISPVSINAVKPVRTRIMICLRISAPASAWAAPAIPRRAIVSIAARAIDVTSCGDMAAVAEGAVGPAPEPVRMMAGDEPSVLETMPEPFPSPRQPALERANWAVEDPRGLFVGVPLQVAEHDRRAERLGEAVELLVELGPGLRGRLGNRLGNPDSRLPAPLQLATPGRLRDGLAAPPGVPRHRASSPPNPSAGSVRLVAPGPGTWPDRRPPRRAGRP